MLHNLPAPPFQLMGKVLSHPERAILRLILMARVARSDPAQMREQLLDFLSNHYAVDARALRAEYHLSPFAAWFQKRRSELHRSAMPHRLGTTAEFGCEALYLAVRAARPQVVVETGVLYGASSAHILEALERNGTGTLHSIELGGDEGEPPHDFLIPQTLKKRWQLILGDSRHELPRLLEKLGPIDFFHHDSLHSFEHMRWEFATAYRYLRPGAVLSSDDVLISHSLRELNRPNAFAQFCDRHEMKWHTFGNVGLAIRGAESPPAPATRRLR